MGNRDDRPVEVLTGVTNEPSVYALRRVNHKRVYRVMRDHALLLYRHGMEPEDQRKHEGKVVVPNSNQRWCFDGLEIPCDNGERVRMAFALDCCDREIMSWVATTKGLDADLIGNLMIQAVEYRFGIGELPQKPVEWLTDNGSCYTAKDTRKFARGLNPKPVTTPVVSPQSNGMAESFVKTLKHDYAALASKRIVPSVLLSSLRVACEPPTQ